MGLVFYCGLLCFVLFFVFLFFWVLTIDYGLVVVPGVCNAAVVVIVVLEQKERERNNVLYCK